MTEYYFLPTESDLSGKEQQWERELHLTQSIHSAEVPTGRSAQPQILPKTLFLTELRRERIRSDRSKSPLSVVICQLSQGVSTRGGDNLKVVRQLLRAGLRESDSISFLHYRAFALLLPDTTEPSAKVVVDKIRSSSSIESVSISTYPDKIFEHLERGLKCGQSNDSEPFAYMPNSKPTQYAIKRAIDLVGAGVGLLILSPLLLLIGIAIRLDSPGPAIFRQTRLGKDFKPFTFYKFRSMSAGADDKVHRDYLAKLITDDIDGTEQDAAGKKFFKIKADSRVTSIGRLIRKTSIDELPQLINVLRGEMSLVGPRPPIPYETENYQAWHLRRILEVKPGLTGLWQVEGRSETTFDEMVRLDLRYTREWSVLLDLKLIFRTLMVVLECRGGV